MRRLDGVSVDAREKCVEDLEGCLVARDGIVAIDDLEVAQFVGIPKVELDGRVGVTDPEVSQVEDLARTHVVEKEGGVGVHTTERSAADGFADRVVIARGEDNRRVV